MKTFIIMKTKTNSVQNLSSSKSISLKYFHLRAPSLYSKKEVRDLLILDGTSMKKDILLVESFSKGSYPADFHPTNTEMMTYTHLIENHDGKIYSKIKESYKLFQSGYYIHTPLMFENKNSSSYY